MKVLLLNGSPHEKGCTYTALAEIAKTLLFILNFYLQQILQSISIQHQVAQNDKQSLIPLPPICLSVVL